ncbi:MAG: hypothetical protein V3S04_04500 [Candidatus Omnitrophota bacterium]
MEQDRPKRNTGVISKTGGLIKDNARIAKDGMIYYLDTLWKLPGAYMASRDGTKSERLSRKRIRRLEDIEAIRGKIEESGAKIDSVREWIKLAREGSWVEDIKKRIGEFELASEELERRIELLKLDYRYFADSFLSVGKDELTAFFNGVDTGKDTDTRISEISESLKQVELIGERAQETASETERLEKDIENFIDKKLSGSKKDKRREIKAGQPSGIRRLATGLVGVLKRVINIARLVTLALYYVARVSIFLIKYCILVPAAFIERVVGLFKKSIRSLKEE